MSDWNAAQYLKFERERTRPARDLLSAVALDNPRHVVDLGCGPGNSTQLLVDRYPQATILGLDTSADMLAKARKTVASARFAEGDVATWRPDVAPDLIYGWLRPGAADVDLWRTTYVHRMDGAAAIVEWVKGTGLRPFVDPLADDERAMFLGRYEEAIAEAYPLQADGKSLLRFPRLFIVATRA